MTPEIGERDMGNLWDVRYNARFAEIFVRGIDLDEFIPWTQKRLATELAVQRMIDAALRLTPTFRDQHPEVDWNKLEIQREQLVYGFKNPDSQLLLETARTESLRLIEFVGLILGHDEVTPN